MYDGSIKVRKVVTSLQTRLNRITKRIIENATLESDTKDVLRNVRIYPVDQRCGRAYYEHRTITIPKWAFETSMKGFLKHYVAHELAHIAAHSKYGKEGWNHGHAFYECLKQLTTNTLHYELDYKPKNAAAAGIKNKNKSYVLHKHPS